MLIREMTLSDEKMMQDFFDEMSEESAAFFNVNRGNEKRTMEFFQNGKKDHKFKVIENDGKIIALCFWWDLNKSIPWFGIAVSDKYQGRGIGRMLINAVFDELQENGYGGLILRTAVNNVHARHLYEKCGFENMGTHPSGEVIYLKRWDMNDTN